MPTPKTVQLFLIDGTPTGPIKCSLSNWTGRVYLVPRTQLRELARERPDLNHNGIYLLFGTAEDDQPSVYVGQARSRSNGSGIAGRVSEHDADRLSYYTHAIIITTGDDYFGPTDISYLEHELYKLASESGRYRVANANIPSQGNVTEEKKAELDEFIHYTVIAVGSLGYKVFEPINSASVRLQSVSVAESSLSSEPDILYFRGNSFSGMGKQTADGFLVLAGSTLNPSTSPTCPPSRERHLQTHQASVNDFRVNRDILFSSPSTAGVFVAGRSVNGLTSWKNSEGIPLRDIEEES